MNDALFLFEYYVFLRTQATRVFFRSYLVKVAPIHPTSCFFCGNRIKVNHRCSVCIVVISEYIAAYETVKNRYTKYHGLSNDTVMF